MKQNLLVRAGLSALAVLMLLAAVFANRSAAPGVQAAGPLDPVQYLPLAIRCGYYPDPITCPPAQNATSTPTQTATNTTTATATNTATATITPTYDAEATAQITIVNRTLLTLTFTLEGPTTSSGSIPKDQSATVQIRPGHYKLTAETHCGTFVKEFDAVSGQGSGVQYYCP